MIDLPHGGLFDEHDLVAYVRASGRNYIIQGQQACSFSNHSKPHSLDYWLRRNYANNRDTKQAENSVLNALVATGLFTVATRLRCPDSGSYCKGIRLVQLAYAQQGAPVGRSGWRVEAVCFAH
jgi:hypothetical protein